MEQLSFEETRIIGSLIEKKHTTPEYYPMTINSLTNACNQKSSRNPVVNFEDSLVEGILNDLRQKQLIAKVTGDNNRVPKYSESFAKYYNLSKQQIAVLCILFLRGAQTVGEIRSRTSRIYEFKDLGEVHNILDEMINRNDGKPLITKLPKDSGREHRFSHLFCGLPEIQISEEPTENLEEKVAQLENEVTELKEIINTLQKDFTEFKESFE